MAILGIHLPRDISRIFAQINVKGDKEPLGHQHVTLLYLGDDVPIEQLAKAVVATYNVTSKTKPFTVSTNRISTFPPHPDHGTVPVICPLVSPPLHDLQARLRAAFDTAKVDYSKKFPEYKPHVTLSYLEDPAENANKALEKEIPSIEWGVADIVLWGGDLSDLRFSANFPLSIGKTASRSLDVLYRAFVRMARGKRAHDADGHCSVTCPCHGGGHPEPGE